MPRAESGARSHLKSGRNVQSPLIGSNGPPPASREGPIDLGAPIRHPLHRERAFGGGRDALPRKEVIQPQLPLRLPCYDFVPVSNPTLGACLPEGLAQRLQVLPPSMT